MLKRSAPRAKSLGADKGYDTADFIAACRTLGVTPHVAAKRSGSVLDGRTTGHAAYAVSPRIRKRIESIFGWLKSVADWRKTKLIGTAKVAGHNLLAGAAYNLVRMASLNGGWDARHTQGQVCPKSATWRMEAANPGRKPQSPARTGPWARNEARKSTYANG